MNLPLPGIDGSNPLGFLASLGLLRIFAARGARLSFLPEETHRAQLEVDDASAEQVAKVVAEDAARGSDLRSLRLRAEPDGELCTDIKLPPAVFRTLLQQARRLWIDGADRTYAGDLAAFATSLEVDQSKGNSKPTALHFTAARQQFLSSVDSLRMEVDVAGVMQSLFAGDGRKFGKNLRWDPRDARAHALLAQDPTTEGTSVDAPLEWLAFRGLSALPVVSVGGRLPATTAVSGRGEEMVFTWFLWGIPADWDSARSLIRLESDEALSSRGVYAVVRSSITRTSQGFGNFAPAVVEPL
jgi:hypothetical protein